MRFRYSISEFIQEEWIVAIFIVAGFELEVLVFLPGDGKIGIYCCSFQTMSCLRKSGL